MNQIEQIRKCPVIIDNRHESLYRASHMLHYVKVLLSQDTPTHVILEIIETCYSSNLGELRETTWEELRDRRTPHHDHQ